MCSRCVRFTREISGEAELQVINRGDHCRDRHLPRRAARTTSWPATSSICARSARCAARTSSTSSASGTSRSTPSVCPDCSTGCSITSTPTRASLPPAAAREPAGPGLLHVRRGPVRLSLRQFQRAHQAAAGPQGRPVDGRRRGRRSCRNCGSGSPTRPRRRPTSVAAILSPFLTCEEAYLLAKYFKGLSARRAAVPRPGAGRRRGRHLSEGPPRPADRSR